MKRRPLLWKLLSAYLVPTVALLVFAPWLGARIARDSLEKEVGSRLTGSAAMAANALKADVLLTLQPGDEGNRTYRNLVARLDGVRGATHAARVYAFTPERRLLVGTGQGVPIGAPIPELARDRLEIERALGGEATPSSVTFQGLDGHTYKSGYAPILDGDGKVVAVVGADASAEFFDELRRFTLGMVGLALACAAAGLLLFFGVGSRWLLQPIDALVRATSRIGRGDLQSPVPVESNDELGDLAGGMDQMRRRLFDREQELQMMLAGIAHEVRNPLGGIELFAGILKEELAGDAEKLSHVAKITRELGHLKKVVEEFLDFARDPKLSLERVGVKALLEEIAELVRPDSDAKGQRLEISAEAALTLEADGSALRRALLNLARNAVQASPGGTLVRLAATTRDGKALLSVQDEGPGVPLDARARIFTPFFTTKEKGLGLGLAFVRRIAEAHGGKVALVEGGKGACFVLEIPLARPPG